MTRREKISCSAVTMVAAPFIGIIVDKLVKVGQPITIGHTVTAGLEMLASTALLGSLGESTTVVTTEDPQVQA